MGVLGLIDLEDDFLDLLCKWIFMPLELGDSQPEDFAEVQTCTK